MSHHLPGLVSSRGVADVCGSPASALPGDLTRDSAPGCSGPIHVGVEPKKLACSVVFMLFVLWNVFWKHLPPLTQGTCPAVELSSARARSGASNHVRFVPKTCGLFCLWSLLIPGEASERRRRPAQWTPGAPASVRSVVPLGVTVLQQTFPETLRCLPMCIASAEFKKCVYCC